MYPNAPHSSHDDNGLWQRRGVRWSMIGTVATVVLGLGGYWVSYDSARGDPAPPTVPTTDTPDESSAEQSTPAASQDAAIELTSSMVDVDGDGLLDECGWGYLDVDTAEWVARFRGADDPQFDDVEIMWNWCPGDADVWNGRIVFQVENQGNLVQRTGAEGYQSCLDLAVRPNDGAGRSWELALEPDGYRPPSLGRACLLTPDHLVRFTFDDIGTGDVGEPVMHLTVTQWARPEGV